jgi:hypothetical protein
VTFLLATAILTISPEPAHANRPAPLKLLLQSEAEPAKARRRTVTWWLRKIFVWAIWIGVGVAIVPVARRQGVSAVKWYFLGLGAFYGPFLAITYGPILLSILIDGEGRDKAALKLALDKLGWLASIGFSAGVACLYKVRRHLAGRPAPGTT